MNQSILGLETKAVESKQTKTDESPYLYDAYLGVGEDRQ